MGLIIDTSVIIAAERGKIDFQLLPNNQLLYISVLTVTELLAGVYRANSQERKIKRSAFVEYIISKITAIPFGIEEARIYGQILDDLFRENITLGSHDLMIGATAIAHGYQLVTFNEKDFKRIKGLEVINMNEVS